VAENSKDKNKKSDILTVMVIAPGAGSMKQYRIKRHWISLAVCGMVLLFGLMLIWSASLYIMQSSQALDSKLAAENLELKNKLGLLENKVGTLKETLDRVSQFERKLRTITGLEDQHTNTGIGPLTSEEMMMAEMERSGPPNEALLQKLQDSGVSLSGTSFKEEMDRLQNESVEREKQLIELTSFLEDQRMQLSHTPAIWPSRGWLTSSFGYRTSPFTGKKKFHEGIDISNKVGTPIVSSADGVVVYVGDLSGYGKTMVINHGFDITTRYAHCSEILVKVGDRVKRGEKVATIGKTGRTTGPHLHYEVRVNGIPQNPMRYIIE